VSPPPASPGIALRGPGLRLLIMHYAERNSGKPDARAEGMRVRVQKTLFPSACASGFKAWAFSHWYRGSHAIKPSRRLVLIRLLGNLCAKQACHPWPRPHRCGRTLIHLGNTRKWRGVPGMPGAASCGGRRYPKPARCRSFWIKHTSCGGNETWSQGIGLRENGAVVRWWPSSSISGGRRSN
jgi:hypothetical protein